MTARTPAAAGGRALKGETSHELYDHAVFCAGTCSTVLRRQMLDALLGEGVLGEGACGRGDVLPAAWLSASLRQCYFQ